MLPARGLLWLNTNDSHVTELHTVTRSLILNRYRDNIASLMDKCFPGKNKPGRKRLLIYSQGFSL